MYQILCASCGAEYTDEWWLCPACNGSLVVRYALAGQVPKLAQFPLAIALRAGMGEAKTPLVPLPGLSQQLGVDLWGKCEFVNPTGSFKDRGSVVEIAKAVELQKAGVVCASTGNMAASLAAYAARAGLRCVVVVPANTPISKLNQALVCGARLVKVAGTYDDCVARAQRLAVQKNLFLCGDYVLRREGQKTIGWELAGKGFDGVVVPVGNGTVGVAIVQGLAEADPAGRTAFIGVQAEAANPLARAWQTASPIVLQQNTKTIASACNVGNPLDGELTLQWVKQTNGQLVSVSDAQILDAQKWLARTEGIFVEASAAATLAGVVADAPRYAGQKLVLILTGSGLKEGSV